MGKECGFLLVLAAGDLSRGCVVKDDRAKWPPCRHHTHVLQAVTSTVGQRRHSMTFTPH